MPDSSRQHGKVHMIDNSMFHLTDEQLRAYDQWMTTIAKSHWSADAAESLQATLSFTFTALGRRVEARVGEHHLLLEDL